MFVVQRPPPHIKKKGTSWYHQTDINPLIKLKYWLQAFSEHNTILIMMHMYMCNHLFVCDRLIAVCQK